MTSELRAPTVYLPVCRYESTAESPEVLGGEKLDVNISCINCSFLCQFGGKAKIIDLV